MNLQLILIICLTIKLASIECQSRSHHFQMETDCDLDSTNSLSNLLKAIPARKKFDCLSECNRMLNCKSASFSSLDSVCRLYDKSQFDAAAVKVPLSGRNLYFKKSKSPTDVVFTELKVIVSLSSGILWRFMRFYRL